MFAATVASQSHRNVACRKGVKKFDAAFTVRDGRYENLRVQAT